MLNSLSLTVSGILLVLGLGTAIFARQTLYWWFMLTFRVVSFLPDMKTVFKDNDAVRQMVYSSPFYRCGIWAWRAGGIVFAALGGYFLYSLLF